MQPYNCPHTPCGIHTPYSMWGSITGCSPTSPHIPPTGSTPRSAPIGCGDYYGMQPHLPCRTWSSTLPDFPKLPAAYTYSPNYDLRRAHQYLHPGPGDSRLRETVLYSPPSTVYVEPNRNEYLELKAKLNAEPDYLEVLEKQTTFSQF